MAKRNRQEITLPEVIAVILVICILAAIAVPKLATLDRAHQRQQAEVQSKVPSKILVAETAYPARPQAVCEFQSPDEGVTAIGDPSMQAPWLCLISRDALLVPDITKFCVDKHGTTELQDVRNTVFCMTREA